MERHRYSSFGPVADKLCALQGTIYDTIISRIVVEAQNDFEEAGLEQDTLQELKQVGDSSSASVAITLLFCISASHNNSVHHTFHCAGFTRPASLIYERYGSLRCVGAKTSESGVARSAFRFSQQKPPVFESHCFIPSPQSLSDANLLLSSHDYHCSLFLFSFCC